MSSPKQSNIEGFFKKPYRKDDPPTPGSPRDLRIKTAQETIAVLSNLLPSLSTPLKDSSLITSPAPLDASKTPNLPAATVTVINGDTLDTALPLISANAGDKPPLILNMASEKHAGGGWLRGSLAQEEAICYRSSLYSTLHQKYYILSLNRGIYSPEIIVIRESLASGHALLDLSRPDELKKLSVISVAAVRCPKMDKKLSGEEVYARDKDAEYMRKKMRLILRVAGHEGHRMLVLGALGCGAFHNPKEEVMRLWREVLGEAEWKGWFEEIVFAVLDTQGEGNFEIFQKGLEGMKV